MLHSLCVYYWIQSIDKYGNIFLICPVYNLIMISRCLALFQSTNHRNGIALRCKLDMTLVFMSMRRLWWLSRLFFFYVGQSHYYHPRSAYMLLQSLVHWLPYFNYIFWKRHRDTWKTPATGRVYIMFDFCINSRSKIWILYTLQTQTKQHKVNYAAIKLIKAIHGSHYLFLIDDEWLPSRLHQRLYRQLPCLRRKPFQRWNLCQILWQSCQVYRRCLYQISDERTNWYRLGQVFYYYLQHEFGSFVHPVHCLHCQFQK